MSLYLVVAAMKHCNLFEQNRSYVTAELNSSDVNGSMHALQNRQANRRKWRMMAESKENSKLDVVPRFLPSWSREQSESSLSCLDRGGDPSH